MKRTPLTCNGQRRTTSLGKAPPQCATDRWRSGKKKGAQAGASHNVNGPLSDVPCHQAPQVAYIVMFVTRWHKNSAAKIQLFRFGWQTRNVSCKVRHAPQERGSVFNLKLKNMKSLKLNQLDSQRLAEKEMLNVTGGQGGWRYDIGPNGTYTRIVPVAVPTKTTGAQVRKTTKMPTIVEVPLV